MENKKKDELQNRREFFKKAAKGALPILGAIVLANLPVVMNAAEGEPSTGCTSCSTHCGTSCWRDGCTSTCTGGCKSGCKNTCRYHVKQR